MEEKNPDDGTDGHPDPSSRTGPDAGRADAAGPPLPGDGHVHTEFSWDTAVGDMEATCARAVELGLPFVAFTDHVDPTVVVVRPEEEQYLPAPVAEHLGPDGVLRPPPLDLEGYLAAVERCRDRYPGLAVLTGAEISEPHWHPDAVDALLARARFDRVLGSLHSLSARGGAADIHALMFEHGPAEALVGYLEEAYRMAVSTAPVTVLAHVDYPVRTWGALTGERFDPTVFEDPYREVLTALAASGRALEMNTVVPLPAVVLRWWRECGGREVTFGSDAHRPDDLARGLRDAAAVVASCGFRPGRSALDPWRRD